VLEQVPLFDDLSPSHLKRLADRMDEQRFMEGASIVKHGDVGDTFYVIVEGEARWSRPAGCVVHRLRPGSSSARSAARRRSSNAAIVAETPMLMLALSRVPPSAS
jgi:cAMP-dependent protein kinase regulator